MIELPPVRDIRRARRDPTLRHLPFSPRTPFSPRPTPPRVSGTSHRALLEPRSRARGSRRPAALAALALVLLAGVLGDALWGLDAGESTPSTAPLDALAKVAAPPTEAAAIPTEVAARALETQHVARARALVATADPAAAQALQDLFVQSRTPSVRAYAAQDLVALARRDAPRGAGVTGVWPDGDHGDFLEEIAPLVLVSARVHGARPSVSLAQAILESGWGGSWLARAHHNLLGLRVLDTAREDLLVFKVRPAARGGLARTPTGFWSYPDAGTGIRHHAAMLGEGEAYAKVRAARNAGAAARALGPVWSSDPRYADKLLALIGDHGLDRWDALVERAVAHDARAHRTFASRR